MPKINISSETTRLNRELIALVREKPILYSNLTKRSTNRTDAWNYISKVLINNSFKKMDVKTTMTRWRQLRDSFVRMHGKITANEEPKVKFIFYDYMTFLIPHIKKKGSKIKDFKDPNMDRIEEEEPTVNARPQITNSEATKDSSVDAVPSTEEPKSLNDEISSVDDWRCRSENINSMRLNVKDFKDSNVDKKEGKEPPVNARPQITNSKETKDSSVDAVATTEEPISLNDEISSVNDWGCRSENTNSMRLLIEAENNQIHFCNQALNQDSSENLKTNEAILVGLAVCNASWSQQLFRNEEIKLISNGDMNQIPQQTDNIVADLNTRDAELEYLNPSFTTCVDLIPPEKLNLTLPNNGEPHIDSNSLTGVIDEPEFSNGYNSEEEHYNNEDLTATEWQEKEQSFEKGLRDIGFCVKEMVGDGACLFRAVADQVHGNEEMHGVVRKDCMDYIEANQKYFADFITEDFITYVRRKREKHVFGNHLEIQAISEMYNTPVELFRYSIEPANIFEVVNSVSDPIRLSYHKNNHYNSVVKVHEGEPTADSPRESDKNINYVPEEPVLCSSKESQVPINNNEMKSKILISFRKFDSTMQRSVFTKLYKIMKDAQ